MDPQTVSKIKSAVTSAIVNSGYNSGVLSNNEIKMIADAVAAGIKAYDEAKR